MSDKNYFQLLLQMNIDVDGAPNAYGPDDSRALDYELNAHQGGKKNRKVVGYLTKDGEPIRQQDKFSDGTNNPWSGYYISTSGFDDKRNKDTTDPRKYVNAAEINYVVL